MSGREFQEWLRTQMRAERVSNAQAGGVPVRLPPRERERGGEGRGEKTQEGGERIDQMRCGDRRREDRGVTNGERREGRGEKKSEKREERSEERSAEDKGDLGPCGFKPFNFSCGTAPPPAPVLSS